jgi:hypothetical protein
MNDYNMMFNMGQISDQHILIMVDEHGTIEAHTHAHLELHKGEMDLAEEFGKKVLFHKEAETT